MRIPIVVVSLGSLAFSAVPFTFSKGQPAVAQQINDNFTALDTSIQKKASQATVDLLATSISGKSDKSELEPLRSKIKADSLALSKANSDALNAKQDALGFTPLNKAGDAMDGALHVGGGILQVYPFGDSWGSLFGDQVGSQEQLNYSFAWRRDGSEAVIRTGTRALTITNAQSAPVYNDGSADHTVWHSGNFDPSTKLTNGGNQGKGIFDEPNPPQGSWAYESFNGSDISVNRPSESANIQVISTGTAIRGLQFAAPYDQNRLLFRRGEDGWRNWDEIIHSGNVSQFALAPTGGTISGDLRITGALTTAPGATPADYVFEPDYKLAPLSEVEAFTQANKHLPEVPSAADMTSSGVDLAKMNMILLKKVEELTLHAIAQEKRLDAQQKLIEELRDSR